MNIAVRKVGDVTIVDFKGRLAIGVSDEVLPQVIGEILDEGGKKILLNLSDMDYIDSNGLGELVQASRLEARRRVAAAAQAAGPRGQDAPADEPPADVHGLRQREGCAEGVLGVALDEGLRSGRRWESFAATRAVLRRPLAREVSCARTSMARPRRTSSRAATSTCRRSSTRSSRSVSLDVRGLPRRSNTAAASDGWRFRWRAGSAR